MEFRWDDWNLDHATRHVVPPAESEHVVRFARRPYPQRHGRGKRYVLGRGTGDRFVQVVYAIEPDDSVYIIPAMPLGGSGGIERCLKTRGPLRPRKSRPER